MIALSAPLPAYPLPLLMIVSLLKPLPGIYLLKWSIKSVFTYLLLLKKRLLYPRRNLLYFLLFIARHFSGNDSFTVHFFLLLWEVTCRELFPIACVFVDSWVISFPFLICQINVIYFSLSYAQAFDLSIMTLEITYSKYYATVQITFLLACVILETFMQSFLISFLKNVYNPDHHTILLSHT